MSSLAAILRAVVAAPGSNDTVASNVLAASAHLDPDDVTKVRLAVAASEHTSAALAATFLGDEDPQIRVACYKRDDIDENLIVNAIGAEVDNRTLQHSATSTRPTILAAVVARLTTTKRFKPHTAAEADQFSRTMSALSTNDALEAAAAAALVTWVTNCGVKIIDEDNPDMQRAYSALARKAFGADHAFASSMLTTTKNLDLVFVLWWAASALADDVTDIAFDRTIVTPLRTEPGVPAVTHSRLYRIAPYLSDTQNLTMSALLANKDLTDCARAEWLRSKYLKSDDDRDVQFETARGSADPSELTSLFDAEPDMSSDLAFTIMTNTACPLPLALRCLRHLAIGHASAAVRLFAHDDDLIVAMIAKWPGLIRELSDERRPFVAFAALMALPAPWSSDGCRFAEGFIQDITDEYFGRLPLDVIAKLIDKSTALAAWAVATVGSLDPPGLQVLARLSDRGELPLGQLCDVAAAI